jgi:anaerobic magnesium-protoporphyrin IX monomethyl ester cyclase
MKVLLINPPCEHMLATEVPTIVNEERGYNPPLGILYLAASIKKFSNHEVKVIDTQVEELGYSDLKERIRRYDPDVIGMTTLTFTLIDVIKLCRIIKKINPKIKIILGGPHVNIYPDETMQTKEVDFIILNEGEEIIVELLDNIDNPKDIKGIVYRDGDKVVHTEGRPFIKDLDKIPFPDRTATPFKKYSSLLAKQTPITTMITSRGCPYKCIFCDRPHLGKMFRARSAKNVVDEMQECEQMGIKEIFIYDDTFTIDRQRVIDICAEIHRRELKVKWDIRARVNTVDKELLKIMKKAGCQRIHYGVEAGNPEILKVLKKGITKDQVRTAFKLTRKEGIDTLAYFMIGSPRETKETILESIEFAKELKPDYVHFTITTPFPATELFSLGLKEGIIARDYWAEYAKNPTQDFIPPLWVENLSKKELVNLLNHAYKEFYTRPIYILQRVLKVRSLGEFRRKMKAGLKVFKLPSSK